MAKISGEIVKPWAGHYAFENCIPASKVSWILGGVLLLALGLLPVYYFPSGRPQLVDGPLVLLLAAFFLRRSTPPPTLRLNVLPLAPFVVWVALVNLVYFLLYPQDYLPLLKSAELFYTFLLFWAFSCLLREFLEAGKIGFFYAGLFLSLALIFTVKGYSEEGVRSALSFNNPNQLGYYALILACMAALLLRFKEQSGRGQVIYYWGDVLLLFAAHVLALLSLSRGALVALFFIDLWMFPKLTRRILALFIPVVLLALVVVIWRPAIIEERLAGRPGREITAESAQEEMDKRIFHQFSIMEGIHYLVGRGGRGFSLKEKARGIHEVHNIFGDIFRSYGIIGLGLFTAWLLKFIWRSRVVPGALFIWAALMLYNMTHYGLRFRAFWILLALLNAMILLENQKRPEGKMSKPGLMQTAKPSLT